MKKLLLTTLLFVSFTINAQQKETFTRTYKSFNTKENGVIMGLQKTDLLVVFNEKETNYICLYYASGKTVKYKPYGKVEERTTNGGEKTQLISAIDISSGNDVLIQLFDSQTLRIIVDEGWFIEFYE